MPGLHTRSRRPRPDAPHVVVVGAGFAGLATVRGLTAAGLRVTVVDRNLYSTFQPLLYQVATGGINPGDVAYPVGAFTRRFGAHYRRGELVAVDPVDRRITLRDGRCIGYDYLILATGVTANHYGVPGAVDHTCGLYTRRDAVVLRDRIIGDFERLNDAGPDGELAVTIVGGGATGVELAGTLAEIRDTVLRETFPDVDGARVHVRLVEMQPELLTPFHPRLRRYCREQLRARGVDVRLGTAIREVTPDHVVLADGATLRSDITVWAAGVAAGAQVRGWNLPQGRGGRILVQPDLRVTGQDRVFAVGDIALVEHDPVPQLAQPALQMGRHVARQVTRLVDGSDTEPFHYRDKGIMATIGRRSAVVQLGSGLRVRGAVAWLAWFALHLVYLLGNRNRVSALVNLAARYVFWGHGGVVIVGDPPSDGGVAAGRPVPVPATCQRPPHHDDDRR